MQNKWETIKELVKDLESENKTYRRVYDNPSDLFIINAFSNMPLNRREKLLQDLRKMNERMIRRGM